MGFWRQAAIAAAAVTTTASLVGAGVVVLLPSSSAPVAPHVPAGPVAPAAPAQWVVAGTYLLEGPVRPAVPVARAAPSLAAPAVGVSSVHPVEPVEPVEPPPEEFSFTLASFNMLGSQHTAKGGDKPGYAPGPLRARWAAALMTERGYDVAGLQEAQRDQLAVVRASGAWASYPDPATSPEPATAQSLVWRDDVWELVAGHALAIPFLGRVRQQPVVLLRHRATGREMWFVNVHLAPRRDRRDGERERDLGTRALAGEVRTLRATGLPIVVTGDMNEHGEIFCDLTSSTALVAAAGGSNEGRCLPPRETHVDWIFGTTDVRWSTFRFAVDPVVRRVTDHTIPVVEVTVPSP